MKPVRRRKLVDEMRDERGVSIRRACHVFLLNTSTYHHSPGGPDRLPSKHTSARSVGPAFGMAAGGFMCCCGGKDDRSARTDSTHLSGVRPAVAQQNTQAPGQGEVAR